MLDNGSIVYRKLKRYTSNKLVNVSTAFSTATDYTAVYTYVNQSVKYTIQG
ncbi:hypothetical protein SAMN06265353_1187 [Hydrogenobacter hydrogenophilus]|uniref:Uncharacterized protein n=1 Tax=Hydrogenobacter hydrogenophilus TaxID=35835 RepID=A0A285NZ46_9AQUI|nr:hypothetical protein SAMN06265353_1187 [Hydrogenobacter hydrogenophilus]